VYDRQFVAISNRGVALLDSYNTTILPSAVCTKPEPKSLHTTKHNLMESNKHSKIHADHGKLMLRNSTKNTEMLIYSNYSLKHLIKITRAVNS